MGSCSRVLVWDNESAVGKWRGASPSSPDDGDDAFRGMLGIKVVLCRAGDPEAKGVVERANGYLETSFLPGCRFSSPEDFDAQLHDWLVTANARKHRGLGCRPIDRWNTDVVAMLELPPTAPVIGRR